MSVFEATIGNVACWATLKVNAPSIEAAKDLFQEKLFDDEWEKVADEEYQMALQCDIECDREDYDYEIIRIVMLDEEDDDEYAAVTWIDSGGNG